MEGIYLKRICYQSVLSERAPFLITGCLAVLGAWPGLLLPETAGLKVMIVMMIMMMMMMMMPQAPGHPGGDRDDGEPGKAPLDTTLWAERPLCKVNMWG